jgi:arylsulfatase A-like enzyme
MKKSVVLIVVLTAILLFAIVASSIQMKNPSFVGSAFEKFPKKNYNIILITFDALGADYLSIYGFDRETAPNLNNFSRQAYIFTNAVSQSATTTMSLCSILASRYHSEDRLIKNSSLICANDFVLPIILRAAGYNNYAIVRDYFAKAKFGFSRGFQYFNDNSSFFGNAEETFNSAIQLADTSLKEPFFLWIHNEEPHRPYIPPERYFRVFYSNTSVPDIYDNRSLTNLYTIQTKSYEDNGYMTAVGEEVRQLRALYLANILYADDNFGRFLDFIKTKHFFDNTIIIISADHGELLGEHGLFDHNNCYQPTIHVPLLIHMPGQDFSMRIDKPVELVDVYPTITNLLGVSLRHQIRGEDLFSANRSKAAQYSECGAKILIKNETKFWRFGNDTFYYNLTRDYHENNPTFAPQYSALFDLPRLLTDAPQDNTSSQNPEELKKELREHGYW